MQIDALFVEPQPDDNADFIGAGVAAVDIGDMLVRIEGPSIDRIDGQWTDGRPRGWTVDHRSMGEASAQRGDLVLVP